MHDVVKVERKTLEELVYIKDDYKILKEQIENLYNTLRSLEIAREHDLEDEDEIEEL